ncbi:MAG: transcriptional repressor [Anaerolineales bacterium]|nr:transcriptional repressor [Anaerolineales bacterium]
MTCSAAHVAEQIRARGFRLTQPRMAILNVLYEAGGHLTPTEIFGHLHPKLPNVSEPTIYRNLDFLRLNGFVRATPTGNGRLEYEIVGRPHHHLRCQDCGTEIEIEHSLLQPLYERLEQSTGYRLNETHHTFLGYCPHCKPKGE